MSKHSEGPWMRNATLIFTESLPSRVICELSEPEPGKWLEHKAIDLGSPNWDEAMANGELLKAAPQLAEALVRLLPWARNISHQDDYPPGVEDDIEAAIAALEAAGVKP